jgi:5'-deoxy-5'-methylthioadenosine phosphorylase
MLAIMGGSGLTELAGLEVKHRQIIRTPYGEPSGPLTFGRLGGHDVVFLARHGYGHTLAPHEINYRANLWALHSKGVTRVAAVCTTGGITQPHVPGSLAVPSQIVDYTWGRRGTYFEGAEQPVVHIDFTHPYDASMRRAALDAAREAGVAIVDGGTYGATNGPRLETAAEINRLERDGCDLVGMTGMPEAALAREIGVAYAAIAVVVNWAAGRATSRDGIVLADLSKTLEEGMTRVRALLVELVDRDGRS